MSVDHFCSSRKLSSALRERGEQGEEVGKRKDKGGGVTTDRAHLCCQFELRDNNKNNRLQSSL